MRLLGRNRNENDSGACTRKRKKAFFLSDGGSRNGWETENLLSDDMLKEGGGEPSNLERERGKTDHDPGKTAADERRRRERGFGRDEKQLL